MDKRKYLIIVCLIIQHTTYTHAGAYLPDVGKYKYYSSVSTIDSFSRKKREERIAAFAEIQDMMYALGNEQQKLIKTAAGQNRQLTNSEKRTIESNSLSIKKLNDLANNIGSFNDDASSCFGVEYGINENQSFGLKIDYTLGKFAEIQNNTVNRTTNVGKDIEVLYKNKLFQNESIIVTLQPAMGYFSYNDSPAYKMELGLLIGHSHEGKRFETFQEIGVIARQSLQKNTNTRLGYVIYITEGFKFKNGFMLTNYTEYEKNHSSNLLYKTTIYEQVSVAKEFHFDSLKVQNFTAQIGYFWKGSRANNIYTISGPIFSLWFNL